MFPTGSPDEFSTSKSKFGYYFTEDLGPYFRKQWISDADYNYYSSHFDEIINSADFKELRDSIQY